MLIEKRGRDRSLPYIITSRLQVRRFLPSLGFVRMAEFAGPECVGTVFARRVGFADYTPLESLQLNIVQRHGGRRFRMGRTMAGLALDAALVAAAVDELAEQARGGGVGGSAYIVGAVASEDGSDAVCRADAGRQG